MWGLSCYKTFYLLSRKCLKSGLLEMTKSFDERCLSSLSIYYKSTQLTILKQHVAG